MRRLFLAGGAVLLFGAGGCQPLPSGTLVAAAPPPVPIAYAPPPPPPPPPVYAPPPPPPCFVRPGPFGPERICRGYY